MPMSTLEHRPTANYAQNSYGDQKYNVMGLIRLYTDGSAQLPWQQDSGQTQLTKVHSIKLPNIGQAAPSAAPFTFYGPSPSHGQPRLNLPSVGRGSAHSSLLPFSSFGKPTCGYYFTRTTEHRKMRIGIPPKFGYLHTSAPPVGGMR